MQKHELLAEVDVLLGGRAAEEVFIGEISTGASNDLERATDIIKAMISMYGMSEIAGLMVLEKQRNTFLTGGQTIKDYSEKTAEALDEYVKATLDERYKGVLATLKLYKDAIETMVDALYEEETIEGEKVRQIIAEFEKQKGMKTRLQSDEKDEKNLRSKKSKNAGENSAKNENLAQNSSPKGEKPTRKKSDKNENDTQKG